MISSDLPRVHVDCEPVDSGRADRDWDFVDEAEVERLLAGGELDAVGEECLLAASEDDFAAMGGWAGKDLNEPVGGGAVGRLVDRMDGTAGRTGGELSEEVATIPQRPAPPVMHMPDGLAARTPMRRMAVARRTGWAGRGRGGKPRRARPPRVASPAAGWRGVGISGPWVMFVSALVSSVLFMLGAILLQRSMPGDDSKVEPASAAESFGQSGFGEARDGAPTSGRAGRGGGEEWRAGDPRPAQ